MGCTSTALIMGEIGLSKRQHEEPKRQQKKIVQIAPYRKQQRRKRLLRRLIWFSLLTLVLVIGGVTWNLLYQEGMLSTGADISWPVSLSGDTPRALHDTEAGVVVTGSGYLHFYRLDATTEERVMHGFSKPVTHTAGKYTLTYDHGGYAVRLDVGKAGSRTATLSHRILFCRIAENGRVLIATQSTKYTTELFEYDDQLNPTGFVYRMNEYIMAASFSGDSSCVVAAQRVKGAQFETVLYGLNFNSQKMVFSTSFPSSMILSIEHKASGAIALICTEELFVLDQHGNNARRYDYPAAITNFNDSFSEVTVIAFTDITSPTQRSLVLFSHTPTMTGQKTEDLTPKAAVQLSQAIRDLSVSDNSVAVLLDDSMEVFNFSLGRKRSVPHGGEYQKLIQHQQQMFALTKNKVHRID